jgi:SAM-dependent methyltransferase
MSAGYGRCHGNERRSWVRSRARVRAPLLHQSTRESSASIARRPGMTEKLARRPNDINELEQLRRQFDAAAASWDAKHGPASPRAPEFAARVRYLRKICAALGRPSVLDLGCGTGQILIKLLPVIKFGIGVDISPAMIERARHAAPDHRLQFCVEDAARFCSQCQGRFDVVLLIGTLGHLPDQVQALSAAGRLIRPRGRLIVISPHPLEPDFPSQAPGRLGP